MGRNRDRKERKKRGRLRKKGNWEGDMKRNIENMVKIQKKEGKRKKANGENGREPKHRKERETNKV
jgi:hypothetical protein